jgi:hypothetical protein
MFFLPLEEEPQGKEEVGFFQATSVDAHMLMITIEVVGHKVTDTLIDGGLGVNIIMNMVRIVRDASFTFPSKDGRSMTCPTHGDTQRPLNSCIKLGVPYYCNNI